MLTAEALANVGLQLHSVGLVLVAHVLALHLEPHLLVRGVSSLLADVRIVALSGLLSRVHSLLGMSLGVLHHLSCTQVLHLEHGGHHARGEVLAEVELVGQKQILAVLGQDLLTHLYVGVGPGTSSRLGSLTSVG